MESVHDDHFMVFIRFDPRQARAFSDSVEQPLASCTTYGEARQIRQALARTGAGDCVIRYVGTAGGGD
jgi:hypothetical protein